MKAFWCAFFSNYVYGPSSVNIGLEGWSHLKSSKPNNVGYYGAAYINQNERLIIIAHRGTTPQMLGNLTADTSLGFSIVPIGQKEASAFSSEIINMTKQFNYETIETGHSLGAAHAELNAAKEEKEFITFDSPGVSGLLSDEERQRSRGTCYLSAPNVINTSNEHTGKLIRIFVHHLDIDRGHEVEDLNSLRNLFQEFVALGGTRLLSLLPSSALMQTVRLHSMQNILATFDKNIGQPYLQKEIVSWPSRWRYAWYQTPGPRHFYHGASWLYENIRFFPAHIRTNQRLEASLFNIGGYQLKNDFIIPNEILINHNNDANKNVLTLAFKHKALDVYDTFFVEEEVRRNLVNNLVIPENNNQSSLNLNQSLRN